MKVPIPDELLPSIDECRSAVRLNRLVRSGSSPEAEFAERWNKEGGEYSVYCLAEDGKRVRYIGISRQKIEKRLAQHLADQTRGKNHYKENWLRSCTQRGIKVTVHVVRNNLTEKQACMIEELLVRLLRRPFRLTNTHAGGATGYAGLSEESKLKHRENTKKGRIRAIQRELDAVNMDRGYCLLEERSFWGLQSIDNMLKMARISRPMDLLIAQTTSSSSLSFTLSQSGGMSWEDILVRQIRERGLSWRTEQSYRNWAKRFAQFVAPRCLTNAARSDVESFLDSLADEPGIGPAAQKQAVNALFLLMQDALRVDLGEVAFRKAESSVMRRPSFLAKDECMRLFLALDDQPRLVAQLIYGCGLRQAEVLTLRTQHVDIVKKQLRVVSLKSGNIDRVALVPPKLWPSLHAHLRVLSDLWTSDQRDSSYAGVWLPANVAGNDREAGVKWDWQWLFPSRITQIDPVTGLRQRHHLGDSGFQMALRSAADRAGLAISAPTTALRRSSARHLLNSGVSMQTVLELFGGDAIANAQ